MINMENESKWETEIHFRELGKHRIMSGDGFYTHPEVLPLLVDNGIIPDDGRFMLTHNKKKAVDNGNV